jgi:hypothetical protein
VKTAMKRRKKTWPKDPRFVVGSVSGWPITQNASGRSRVDANREPPTIWYVFDRFYCYLPVGRFYAQGYGKYGAKQEAQTFAAEMNRLDREWEGTA